MLRNYQSLLWAMCSFSYLGAQTLYANADASLDFRKSINLDSIRAHQRALQEIAEQNNGNRRAGSAGFNASVAYVKTQLENVGYEVKLQDFLIHLSNDNSAPELIKIGTEQQGQLEFVAGEDFSTMSAQGFAQITAEIEAVDLKIPSPAPNHSSSGCEEEDFKDFKRGNIALIQRGTCTFLLKAENALKAGAVGVIIFNEGNEGRTGSIDSRLPKTFANYPVLGASFFVGENLSNAILHGPTGINVFLKVDVLISAHSVQNVIAESKTGEPARTVVVGAHLDGVHAGPGMNDNGSGSASILEIAKKYAELEQVAQNKLRFIWFAAEELGLLGSEFYVESLSRAEKNNILSMLNFDMLGSANYARFVYDGDNSAYSEFLMAHAAPEGSAYIEKIFLDFFSSLNLASHPTAFDGRSDYGPFIEVGIPAGGLFSGAEGVKNAELARIYGGVAGKSFDPCYHKSCDDFAYTDGNNGSLALKSLDELSQAAAHAVFLLSQSKDNIRSAEAASLPSKIEFEYRGGLLIK